MALANDLVIDQLMEQMIRPKLVAIIAQHPGAKGWQALTIEPWYGNHGSVVQGVLVRGLTGSFHEITVIEHIDRPSFQIATLGCSSTRSWGDVADDIVDKVHDALHDAQQEVF